MRFLSSFLIYVASLVPIAALAIAVSDRANIQITNSYAQVVTLLEALGRPLI